MPDSTGGAGNPGRVPVGDRVRRRLLLGAAGIAGSAALIGAAPAASADAPSQFVDEARIRQLSTLYALGTDAIGRKDVAAGIAYYRRTFTERVEIMVAGSAGTLRVGPEAWAAFVDGEFRRGNYDRTQHLIGTVNVVPGGGDRASMSSYLHATHHVADNSALSIVLGTYDDIVVRERGEWRIARRTLSVMTSWTQKPN